MSRDNANFIARCEVLSAQVAELTADRDALEAALAAERHGQSAGSHGDSLLDLRASDLADGDAAGHVKLTQRGLQRLRDVVARLRAENTALQATMRRERETLAGEAREALKEARRLRKVNAHLMVDISVEREELFYRIEAGTSNVANLESQNASLRRILEDRGAYANGAVAANGLGGGVVRHQLCRALISGFGCFCFVFVFFWRPLEWWESAIHRVISKFRQRLFCGLFDFTRAYPPTRPGYLSR